MDTFKKKKMWKSLPVRGMEATVLLFNFLRWIKWLTDGNKISCSDIAVAYCAIHQPNWECIVNIGIN